MSKNINKKISKIRFQQDSVIMEAKGDGRVALLFMSPLGVILLGFGIVFGISTESITIFLISGLLGSIVLGSALFLPFYLWFEINPPEGFFKYYYGSFWTRGKLEKSKSKEYPFDSLTIDWEGNRLFKSVVILIQADERSRFTLTVPAEQHAKLIKWLDREYVSAQSDQPAVELSAQISPFEESPSVEEETLLDQKDTMGYASMLNEITSWGRSSLLLGVVHIVASGLLNPGWGVTLLAVGGLSFIFKEASMFIMYAVTLIWVGISNIMSLDIGLWTFFGAYQIYLGAMLFKKYRRYRDYEQQHLNSLEAIPTNYKAGRSQKFFPWTGSLLSGLGLVVYVGVWLAVFVAMVVGYDEAQDTIAVSDSLWTIFDLVGGVALGFGIVGLGLSISSVASKYKPEFIAWAGVVMGSLLVIVEVAIRVWNLLG